jgi:signal peptidase I
MKENNILNENRIEFEVYIFEDDEYKYYTAIYYNPLIERVIPNVGDFIIIENDKLKVNERLINYNTNIVKVFAEYRE